MATNEFRATLLTEKVEREQLRIGVVQHRRLAVPHFLTSLVVVALAWNVGVSHLAIFLWLLVTAALQLVRFVYVHRLLKRIQTLLKSEVKTALLLLSWWVRSQGVVNAIMMIAMFLEPLGQEQYLATMVWIGNAAGTVFVVGGRTALFIQWASVYGGTLVLAWVFQGTWATSCIGALAVLLFVIQSLYVRDQNRTMVELISLSDSLQQERDRVASISASKTRFFAAASHDLRQPLTALAYHAATIQAVASRDDDSILKLVGDGISRALDESASLLDSLLEVSKLDAGAIAVQWEKTEVASLVFRVCEDFTPIAKSRGIALCTTIPSNLVQVKVYTDKSLLRRILQNLVANAIKFTDHGHVSIELTDNRGSNQSILSISVQDTGCGIPQEAQEKIFEEFFQLDNSERDRTRGLGLGLAIVHRIALLLHLRVDVESHLGRGSKFTLNLPVSTLASNEFPSPREANLEKVAPSRTEVSWRVLCLDDEPEVRTSLSIMLTVLGFDVRIASNIEEARSVITRGYEPDILLVDFRLQNGVSGLDAISQLRSMHSKSQALLITGDTSPDRIMEANAAGIGVLYKPVDGQLLIDRIYALMR